MRILILLCLSVMLLAYVKCASEQITQTCEMECETHVLKQSCDCDTIPTHVGLKMRQARIKFGYRLPEMAKILDMRVETLSIIEDGKAEPMPRYAERIKSYLDVDIYASK